MEDNYVSIDFLRKEHQKVRPIYQIQPKDNNCYVRHVGEWDGPLNHKLIGSFKIDDNNPESLNVVIAELLYDHTSLLNLKNNIPFLDVSAGLDDPDIKLLAIFNLENAEDLMNKLNGINTMTEIMFKGNYSIVAYKKDHYRVLEKIDSYMGIEVMIERMLGWLYHIMNTLSDKEKIDLTSIE